MMKNLLLWVMILAVVLLGSKAGAAVVKDVRVPSAAMNKEVPVAVILPESYREGEMERFPVIYMLHGAGGSWLYYSHGRPAAETRRLVDEYDVIAVAPDGGATSWWLDSPVDPTCRYETFVTEELVPYVDANYRTKAERGKRAIMGASMGGHGACWIGFRHKDKEFDAVQIDADAEKNRFVYRFHSKKSGTGLPIWQDLPAGAEPEDMGKLN